MFSNPDFVVSARALLNPPESLSLTWVEGLNRFAPSLTGVPGDRTGDED